MAATVITEKFVGNTTSGGGAGGVVSSSAARTSASKPSTSGATANSCDTNDSNGHTCYTYEEVHLGDMDGVEDHHYHHHRHHQYKLPIWVGCNCKLVSGISKSTTCHDLISYIAPSSQDPFKYVLVEKWKKMERILDPSVKILKVWKAWGDQIGDVSFVLRSAPPADGYIDKKSSRKIHRKRSSSYHQQKEEDCDKEEHRDAMEQLIKLVLTQGEAIQAQLKKLRQQEVQIERYEEKMHKIRSSQHGENYVVDTYLKDDVTKGARKIKRREKSPCKRDAHGSHHHHHHHHRQSRREQLQDLQQPQQPEQSVQQLACETESQAQKKHSTTTTTVSQIPVENTEDIEDVEDPADVNDEESKELIKEKTEMMENIFQINVKLTQEEEQLVKLGLKIRKLSDKQRKAEWEELAMQDIRQELEHLKDVTNEQSQEIESNEMNLTALEQLLDDKHDHVAFLTHELQLMDEESEMLQRKVLERESRKSAGNSQQQNIQLEQPPLPSPQQVQFHPTNTVQDPSMAVYSNQYHHQQQFDYQQDELLQSLMKCSIKTSSRGDQAMIPTSQNTYQIQPPPHQQLCTTATVHHNYPQEEQTPLSPQVQHTPVDGCSSSCSNSSSSVCVQLSQKQCISTNNSKISLDPQDNDSNSDTGISSLHSSVDENPMYVLDTLV